MKKFLIIPTTLCFLLLAGCQEVEKKVDDLNKQAKETAKTVEETKETIDKTVKRVDQKVQQAKDASNAINKLLNE